MKKQHLSATTLAQLSVQHDSRQLLAALLRIVGLHRLGLALELVSETFEAAAAQPWFRQPSNPMSFLLTIAQQKALEAIRLQNLTDRLPREVNLAVEAGKSLEAVLHDIFEEKTLEANRLALLFACCHPLLPMPLRKALVLKVNFTFTEKDIQHLRHSDDLAILRELDAAPDVILQHGVQSGVPSPGQFPVRLAAVLDTILSLFMDGYEHSDLTIYTRRSFCDTAFQVESLLLENPAMQQPTTYALMSVMSLFAARFEPRRGRPPSFLFLDEKNRAKWNPKLVDQGVAYYERAGDSGQPSEYHLLARILMEHTLAPNPRFTNWDRILEYLQLLAKVAPSFHYQLCFAYVWSKKQQPSTAIHHLFATPGFSEHLRDDWATNALMGDFYRQAKSLREAARYYQAAQQKAPTTTLKKVIHRKMLALTSAKKGGRKKRRW